MGWKNYGYVSRVRGVEPHERNVLWYLADEADGNGYIEALRLSKLSKDSETPRRRLLQILQSLEQKQFIERFQRVWDDKLKQVVKIDKAARRQTKHGLVLGKQNGKQVATGYRLRFDRFFPASDSAPTWNRICSVIEKSKVFADGVFKIYILSVKQTYYVRRTGLLCILASSSAHKRFLDSEAVPMIIRAGVDLDPRVVAVEVFVPPTVE